MGDSWEELYNYEKWSIQALIGISALFFSALALGSLDIENPLTSMVMEFYIDPVLDDAGSDAGYNEVNTITYAVVLALFVAALSAWLRFLGIDASEATILALLPYVLWASLGEVAEDAEMFDSTLTAFFVSPGIHFQTAHWVVIAGAFGYSISRREMHPEHKDNSVEVVSSILILAQFVLYGSSISNSEVVAGGIDLSPFAVIGISAIFTPWFFRGSTIYFSHVQRVVYFVGLGGSMIFFGALSSYAASVPEDQLILWPLLVVIGVPVMICITMYSWGSEAASALSSHGLVAGILPPGMTEDDYQMLPESSSEKEILEKHRKSAAMAYPVVFLAVSGQVLDGLATWIGIEYFGYQEKHLVSAEIIEIANSAFGFTLIKAGLGVVIWYFFAVANFEHRERHLRLLVGLMMLVVGMAPGLRDVGRLVIGV